MNRIKTLALVGALTAAGSVSAEDTKPVVVNDPYLSTVGPELGLTPGLIAAGIAVTIIGIAGLNSSSGS